MTPEILALRSKTNHTEEELQMVLAARDEYVRTGNRKGLAQCLLVLSFVVKWARSDTDAPPFVRSAELGSEALAIFREIGDKQGMLDALLNVTPFQGGDTLDEAMALAEELGDEVGIASVLATKGKQLALTNPDAAIDLQRKALEIYRKHGKERAVANCLFSLSIAGKNDRNKMEAAVEAAGIFRQLGDRHAAARAMVVACMQATEVSSLEHRKQLALKGLEDAQSVGATSTEGVFYSRLAEVAKAEGNKKEAAQYRRWAKDLEQASGIPKPTAKEAKSFLKDIAKQFPGIKIPKES